jgi:26S proteasome regulatory subunit T2
MTVATLEEIIDDDHVIVSHGLDYYIPMLSIVDKDLIEPGCSAICKKNLQGVVGVLTDD